MIRLIQWGQQMDDNMLVQQNKVLIALLARSTIGLEYIENIVRSGKKKGNPNDFVRAYNALDSTRTVTEIAQMVGGTRQNMSQVLQNWEDKGIVYNVGTSSQPVYFGLLKLSLEV
jgi:DNA-directed RNA polymerase specialized sigma subunit